MVRSFFKTAGCWATFYLKKNYTLLTVFLDNYFHKQIMGLWILTNKEQKYLLESALENRRTPSLKKINLYKTLKKNLWQIYAKEIIFSKVANEFFDITKKDPFTVDFKPVCSNFLAHLFWRITFGYCFWKNKSSSQMLCWEDRKRMS